ncbi:MAG: hypothetical protein UX09_C0037G0011 [Candidatus Uhrbacteria bacterium GW2011_GWE2_45_35]|uniref:Uncharacterized protein n=1 Tax=Candidatus Uhrbacteria bacterium GW2011_GWE2_45_35 TaxID=1618993 RepID=A0A0G1QE87_9BACT|nr:MAG: hypothetical protein UX09_C0037G0011 [Candidatus Uhrbacteria bacterium GW2011_GWE2_45_35]
MPRRSPAKAGILCCKYIIFGWFWDLWGWGLGGLKVWGLVVYLGVRGWIKKVQRSGFVDLDKLKELRLFPNILNFNKELLSGGIELL